MLTLLRRKSKGFTLIELLIAVAILGILAAIAIPHLLSVQVKSRYARAASETKTATTQAIVYFSDKGQNPGALAALRAGGYANVADNDPWGTPYKVSGTLQSTSAPATSGEMGVCSVGPAGPSGVTDAYCVDGFDRVFQGTQPGSDGSVGYSSIYGSWQGQVVPLRVFRARVKTHHAASAHAAARAAAGVR